MKLEQDHPEEKPGHEFAAWWKNYQDPNIEIATTGELFGKCREEAAELIDRITRDAPLPAKERTDHIRMLSCLILEAYENDRWHYDQP